MLLGWATTVAISIAKRTSLLSVGPCPMWTRTTTLWLVAMAIALPAAMARAEVVAYAAPQGETLSPDYEVWADGKKVDVYAARVLDPPFAGKEWDFGGP
jgi:hypothetical protein